MNGTATADGGAVRVLHVVGGMDRGGVETWLMHLLRRIDRGRIAMDFLVHTTRPCAYDDEVRALGARIIRCLRPSQPWAYSRNFRRVVAENGPYDIVHSHVHHYSGNVLRLAHRAGVPMRIAHSHNDLSTVEARADLPRRAYVALMSRWIRQHATVGLAASRDAAVDLFGPQWEGDRRWRVLFYCIDLDPFEAPVDRAAVRTEWGIPAGALVLGHVGRFDAQKNHVFLIEIAREVARLVPRMRLLLVGDGPLRPQIERWAAELGLGGEVLFAGARPDIPRLMRGAMDVFLFPSLYEGLGLVLVEAQASGLPCVISDAIPSEAVVVGPLVRRLSLALPPRAWAEAALVPAARVPAGEALAAVRRSPFDVTVGRGEVERLYLQCPARRSPAPAAGPRPGVDGPG